MILIVMGVSGSGKSTVAQLLASLTGWQFAEGDSYHCAANCEKMSAGTPLSDEDRMPWLACLHQVLKAWHEKGQSGVLTCSALRQSYRNILCEGIPATDYRLVMLEGSRELFAERLSQRRGHFMSPALLASQIATLELPLDALRVSVEGTPETIAREILDKITAQPESPIRP